MTATQNPNPHGHSRWFSGSLGVRAGRRAGSQVHDGGSAGSGGEQHRDDTPGTSVIILISVTLLGRRSLMSDGRSRGSSAMSTRGDPQAQPRRRWLGPLSALTLKGQGNTPASATLSPTPKTDDCAAPVLSEGSWRRREATLPPADTKAPNNDPVLGQPSPCPSGLSALINA